MKIKIIEILVLASIIALLGDGGCDSSCLDFETSLNRFLGLSHYIQCVGTPQTGYHAEESTLSISLSGGGVSPVATYVPASEFDCNTSDNGFGGPLPHMRSGAPIPSAPAPFYRSPGSGNSREFDHAHPAAQTPLFKRYGYNDGYVAPGVVDPYIPVPSNSNQSVPSACPANPPDVLIVNHGHDSVTRLGTCPFSSKATIPVVSRPLQVAVTPDGALALVTSFDNAVNFIDLTSNTVSFTLKTDATINPAGVSITPDGKRAYVTSFNNVNSVILVIDIGSHAVLTTIPAGAWPQGAFVTPDGSQLWVSYPFGNEVDVFDTLTNTQTTARVVNSPSGIAFNMTGTRAYVASGGSPGSLVELDTATFQKLGSYTVGNYPVDVNVLPDGRFVVVNNFASGNLSIVDTATGMVVTGQSTGPTSLGLMRIY